MSRFKILVCLVASLSLVACGGQFKTAQILQDVNSGKLGKTGGRPACEIQAAEYALDTKMISFEMESSTGLSMGFNLLNSFLKLFQVSFKTKSGRLSLEMSLYDPMKPQVELMNVLGDSVMRGNEFSFDLSYQQIGVGFSHYSQTPIAKLSKKGLENALGNLTAKINQLQDPWSTEVVALPSDNEAVVPVGSFTGLKLGDQFAIYNVDHIWEGEPCKSEHLFVKKTTPYPVAIAEVTQIENNAALLTVIERDQYAQISNMKIENGSFVEIHKLTEPERKLFRSLEIRSVIGAEMQFENSQKIDLTPHLTSQIRSIAHSHGFVIYGNNP